VPLESPGAAQLVASVEDAALRRLQLAAWAEGNRVSIQDARARFDAQAAQPRRTAT
jgi:hypothetical protein